MCELYYKIMKMDHSVGKVVHLQGSFPHIRMHVILAESAIFKIYCIKSMVKRASLCMRKALSSGDLHIIKNEYLGKGGFGFVCKGELRQEVSYKLCMHAAAWMLY